MPYWTSYHARGEAGPRVDTLGADGVTVIKAYTWTDIAAAALLDSDNVAPVMREGFELDEVVRVALDGEKMVQVGGFYYRAVLEIQNVDKATAGEMAAVVNHCGKGGHFKVNFYPHSDNTDIYFVARVKGSISDLDVKGRPFAGGHSANLVVEGLEPFEKIPWPIGKGMKFMAKGSWAVYSAEEKGNTLMGSRANWGTFSAAEKSDTLGYEASSSEVVEID
jgi:hypothetical protein